MGILYLISLLAQGRRSSDWVLHNIIDTVGESHASKDSELQPAGQWNPDVLSDLNGCSYVIDKDLQTSAFSWTLGQVGAKYGDITKTALPYQYL